MFVPKIQKKIKQFDKKRRYQRAWQSCWPCSFHISLNKFPLSCYYINNMCVYFYTFHLDQYG